MNFFDETSGNICLELKSGFNFKVIKRQVYDTFGKKYYVCHSFVETLEKIIISLVIIIYSIHFI